MEKGKEARDREKELAATIAGLAEEVRAKRARWQEQRDVVMKIKKLKEQADGLRVEMEQAERRGDLQRAAELKYGRLPELERRIEEQSDALKRSQELGLFLREEVTEEDVAGVVARWTGIPVAKMLEQESDRLLHMEERIHDRLVGQDEAVARVAKPSACRAPGSRTRTAPSARSCSWVRPGWARPSSPRRSPSSSSTTSGPWCAWT